MFGFWGAFSPDLAATLVGVIVGVPVALWINRQSIQRGERIRERSDRVRVADALSVVCEAIAANTQILDNYASILANDQALFELALDTSAWETVRSDVTSVVAPGLRRGLALHFGRLQSLTRLNDLFITFIVGTNASMSTAGETRSRLKSELHKMATRECATAKELAASSQAAIAVLRDATS